MVGSEFLKNSLFLSVICKYLNDILLISCLTVFAGLASYLGSQQVDSSIIPYDVWFDADIPRVIDNMKSRWSDHYRSKVHPLFSLTVWPAVHLLTSRLGNWSPTAIRLIIAAVASIWISTIFITLRLLGCQRLDAAIFSIMGCSSAAAIFWFVVPETYPFGSLTIALALCLVSLSLHRKLPESYFIIINAVTLSMTTTNWMVGILATATHYHWKRALQIIVNGFSLVVLLWVIQKYMFPSAVFFLGDREEERYIKTEVSFESILKVSQSFFYHSMIMPAIQEVHVLKEGWPRILTQNSLLGSAGKMGTVAVLIWTGLLGLGFWALFYLDKCLKLRIVLGLSILGQLSLHVLYGAETFLYSLHFIPLLVILTALSTLTPARPLTLLLAGGLILTASYNNGIQFNKAIDFVEEHRSQRNQVLRSNAESSSGSLVT